MWSNSKGHKWDSVVSDVNNISLLKKKKVWTETVFESTIMALITCSIIEVCGHPRLDRSVMQF